MLLFLKQDNPPALKPCVFGEPLEHCVQAEGAEGAVAAVQPHQWNQLLLFSFILVFFFHPLGAADAVISPGKAPGKRDRFQSMDPWWGTRSFGKPTIANALLQAGDCWHSCAGRRRGTLTLGPSIPALLLEDWGRVGQTSGVTVQEAAKKPTGAAAWSLWLSSVRSCSRGCGMQQGQGDRISFAFRLGKNRD